MGRVGGKFWVLWIMAVASHYHPALLRGPTCPPPPPNHSPTFSCLFSLQLWGPHTPLQLVGVLLIFQFDELKILLPSF